MKSVRRLALLAGLAGAAAVLSCEQEQPSPKASLNRPAGLAAIARTPSTRTDIFVADSEVNGVRLLQVDTAASNPFQFLRAPASYFPLAIPAAGFPTRVATSTDGKVLFVLSPLRRSVHLIDVTFSEKPIGGTALDWESLFPIREHALAGYAPSPTAIPVDIALIETRGKRHTVAVAFDDPMGPTGFVSAITFEEGDGQYLATAVETATVAPAPRNLAVRTIVPRGVLVSSARPASTVISLLPIQTGTSAGRLLGTMIGIDAGGPTTAVIDAGRAGAVGLRADVEAAVIFDLEADVLVRSTRDIPSPYTPLELRGKPEIAGIAYLYNNPLVTGAYTRVTSIPNADSQTQVSGTAVMPAKLENDPTDYFTDPGEAERKVDVVGIAHTNARVSFLIGRPLRVPVSTAADIVSLEILGEGQVTAPVCENAAATPPCKLKAGTIATPLSTAQLITAAWRGALKTSEQGLLAPLATTATASFYALTDYGRRSFAPFQVRRGDQALVQLRAHKKATPSACASTDPYVEVIATATVSAVEDAKLTLAFAPGDAIDTLDPCGGSLQPDRYELYPSVAEIVVISRDSAGVAEVLDRIPTSSSATTAVVNSRVHFSLNAEGGFTCRQGPRVGDICISNDSCGGASCAGISDAGVGRCEVTCAENDPTCVTMPVDRLCSGATFTITSARTNLVDLGVRDESRIYEPGIPDSMIWVDDARGFVVSLPGSRAVEILQPSPSSGYARIPF